MPSRKDLRVIQGGKLTGVEPAIDQPLPIEATQLLERVARYRSLLPSKPDDDIAALVDDLEDAIKALQRLEQSTAPEAQPRASEYRRLIAEIDAEVVAALQADKSRRP